MCAVELPFKIPATIYVFLFCLFQSLRDTNRNWSANALSCWGSWEAVISINCTIICEFLLERRRRRGLYVPNEHVSHSFIEVLSRWFLGGVSGQKTFGDGGSRCLKWNLHPQFIVLLLKFWWSAANLSTAICFDFSSSWRKTGNF